MSAITNDDMLVATMIDSLSGQLKYLIGTTGNMVILQQEIACISNYFKLIEVRFPILSECGNTKGIMEMQSTASDYSAGC